MIANDIHSVFTYHPHESGAHRRAAGRFMTRDGKLHILEDYHGLLSTIFPHEGDMDQRTALRVHRLPQSSHIAVESLRNRPTRPAQPQQPASQAVDVPQEVPQAPSPVFEYHRVGMDRPHVVEFKNGHATLDGNLLDHQDLQTMMDNHRKGAAKIRYRSNAGAAINKMEQVFQDLSKADPEEAEMDPAEAFKHLQAATKQGTLPPAVERAMRRAIYTDPMMEGKLGNKFAYSEFLNKPRPGVHIAMDGNDFRHINNLYGHEAGDTAIKVFGRAAREAMDEAVGQHQAKLFRTADQQNLYRSGGDEFAAHVPTHEHAALFARKLREKLDAIPPINGAHRLSMSFGFGSDPGTADKALYEAKKQKLHPGGERKFLVGQTPSFAHSLVPGAEGPIPLSGEQVPMVPPQPATLPAPQATAPQPTLPKPTPATAQVTKAEMPIAEPQPVKKK